MPRLPRRLSETLAAEEEGGMGQAQGHRERMMQERMCFRGKPVEDMSREELVEALRAMGALYRQATEDHMRAWASLRSLRCVGGLGDV